MTFFLTYPCGNFQFLLSLQISPKPEKYYTNFWDKLPTKRNILQVSFLAKRKSFSPGGFQASTPLDKIPYETSKRKFKENVPKLAFASALAFAWAFALCGLNSGFCFAFALAVLCFALLCYATLCAVLCSALLCYAMLGYTML